MNRATLHTGIACALVQGSTVLSATFATDYHQAFAHSARMADSGPRFGNVSVRVRAPGLDWPRHGEFGTHPAKMSHVV